MLQPCGGTARPITGAGRQRACREGSACVSTVRARARSARFAGAGPAPRSLSRRVGKRDTSGGAGGPQGDTHAADGSWHISRHRTFYHCGRRRRGRAVFHGEAGTDLCAAARRRGGGPRRLYVWPAPGRPVSVPGRTTRWPGFRGRPVPRTRSRCRRAASRCRCVLPGVRSVRRPVSGSPPSVPPRSCSGAASTSPTATRMPPGSTHCTAPPASRSSSRSAASKRTTRRGCTAP